MSSKSDNTRIAEAIVEAGDRIGRAIMPFQVTTAEDATGGSVGSLTEASMGITAGLVRVAEAIDRLAAAVRDHKS